MKSLLVTTLLVPTLHTSMANRSVFQVPGDDHSIPNESRLWNGIPTYVHDIAAFNPSRENNPTVEERVDGRDKRLKTTDGNTGRSPTLKCNLFLPL